MPGKPIAINTVTTAPVMTSRLATPIVKTLAVTVALVGAAAFGCATLSAEANRLARADVALLVAGTPGLSVGAVEADPFGGRVKIRDVAIVSGSLHVYARTLDLPAPALNLSSLSLVTAAHAEPDRPVRLAQWPRATEPKAPEEDEGGIDLKIPGQTKAPIAESPAPAGTLGAASATDVTITTDGDTFTIKSIELAGTPLSNAALASLIDPKSPETITERLKKVTARTITIPLVTSVNKADGAIFEAKNLLFTNVAEGRIETASVAGLTASKKTPTTDTVTRTGAIQAANLDLPLLLQIIGTKRADDKVPLKVLAKSFAINDISNVEHDPTGTSKTTIAVVAESDLMVRPLKTDMEKLEVTGDPQATARRQKALADDIFSSFSYGSISIDKLKFSMAENKDPVDVSIGRIALDKYQDRTFGAFTIRDVLVGQGAGGKASLATVDFSTVVLPIFDRPAATIAATPADAPSIGKFDLTRFDIDSAIVGSDGTPTKLKFKIGHVGSVADPTSTTKAQQASMVVDNVTFDVPGDTPAGKQFVAMGYGHVDLSALMNASYDQTAETLSIPKFLISGVDMGSVTFAIDLVSVSKNLYSQDKEVSQAAALAILLKRLDVTLTNKGLADKALAFKAQQDGTTIVEERDAVVVFLSNLASSLGEGPGIKTLKSAVVAFVKDPKTLHIAATSKDGFGSADVMSFSSPDDLLSHLDITAEANK